MTENAETVQLMLLGRRVLDLPMREGNGADAATVRDYLRKLLTDLWTRGESFSGKRPFGDSGWEYELYLPLLTAGLVRGKVDGEGDIDDIDDAAAHELILVAIQAMTAP